MIKTHVAWEENVLSEEKIAEIRSRVVTMETEGKTNGLSEMVVDPNNPTHQIYARHWNTDTAAAEWITFIKSYSPVYAQIIN